VKEAPMAGPADTVKNLKKKIEALKGKAAKGEAAAVDEVLKLMEQLEKYEEGKATLKDMLAKNEIKSKSDYKKAKENLKKNIGLK
jgi:hypothetical protein